MYSPSNLDRPLLPIPEEKVVPFMGIVLLVAAIVSEVVGTTCMKLTVLSEWWRVAAYMCYAVSFSLFPTILQQIPLSVAYATWSSVGTVSITLVSLTFFEETLNLRQICATCGIVISVVLLQDW